MSLAMSQLCPCEGNNPTCFRCDGWGFLRSGPPVHTLRLAGELSHAIPAAYKEKLWSAVAPSKRGRKSSGEIGQIATHETCPACLQPIPVGHMLSHLRSFHASARDDACTSAEPQRAVSRRRRKPKRETLAERFGGLIQCSACDRFLRAEHLAEHMATYHALSRAAATGRPKGTPKGKLPTKHQHRDTSSNVREPAQFKNLDATRDYFAAYRDYGQFGSYPSHDGYGEESEP